MRTCHQCGASDWHPDVARCTRADCELIHARQARRAVQVERRGANHGPRMSALAGPPSSGNAAPLSPSLEIARG